MERTKYDFAGNPMRKIVMLKALDMYAAVELERNQFHDLKTKQVIECNKHVLEDRLFIDFRELLRYTFEKHSRTLKAYLWMPYVEGKVLQDCAGRNITLAARVNHLRQEVKVLEVNLEYEKLPFYKKLWLRFRK